MNSPADILAEALRPKPRLDLDDWSDRHRVLSSVGSAEAGPWRTSRVPFMRQIMKDLSPSSRVEEVRFMKGAQVAATETAVNWACYTIEHDPSPMLFVQGTLHMCQRLVKQKLDPAIDASPAVASKLPPRNAKEGGNSSTLKTFPGGLLMFAGAQSASGLRSASVAKLFCDEVDDYPADLDGEGDPIDLAIARTSTFPRRKVLIASTPTVEGTSRIEHAYESTQKRRYFVPCPECGDYQTIEWERIKWDEQDLERPAWLVCEHGECVIEEHHKTKMLAAGEWRDTAPDTSGGRVVGYHLSSLYSPYGWTSWSDLRDKYLEAKGVPSMMKTFVNTKLGKTFREVGVAPPWRSLYDRRETYEPGVVPRGGVILTAGVDVQGSRIEVEVRAWGRRHESWSIEHIIIPGNTAKLEGEDSPWAELSALMVRDFPYEVGGVAKIERLAIDSGHQTQTVYAWSRAQPRGRVMVVKGLESLRSIFRSPRAQDVRYGGKKVRGGVQLYDVGTSTTKSELYGWLMQEAPMPGEAPPIGWMHWPEYGPEYFKQLTAEELVTKTTRTGHTKREWVVINNRPNETLDMAVYNRAAVASLGIDRQGRKEEWWAAIEANYGIGGVEPQPLPDPPSPDAEGAAMPQPDADPVEKPKPPKKRKRKQRRRRSSYWDR